MKNTISDKKDARRKNQRLTRFSKGWNKTANRDRSVLTSIHLCLMSSLIREFLLLLLA